MKGVFSRGERSFGISFVANFFALAILFCATIDRSFAASKFRGLTVDSAVLGQDIDTLKSWNVNLVYYFLDPNVSGIAMNEADYLAKLDAELVMLDERLAQYSQRGIKVAINLYGAPGEFASKAAPAQHRVFSEQWAQDALRSAWRKIAERYKGNPTVWGYNLLNEPAERQTAEGLKNWASLSLELVSLIRTFDSNVRIIIQSRYGNPDRLKLLPIIKTQGPVIYSFNAYTPFNYTHQGLYGIPFNIQYPTRRMNAAKIKQGLNGGLRYAKSKRLKLFISEFAVVRWAPGAPIYLRDMARILESNSIDWTVHAFYGSKVEQGAAAYPWSFEHSNTYGDLSLAATQTDRLKMLLTFFARNRF
jgi:endoglucanase